MRTLLIAVLLVGAAGATEAQQGGEVTGTILDMTGAPLPSVAVSLQGPVAPDTFTGSDGRFAFVGLPAGRYELSAALDGFATERRTLTIASGQPVTLPLTMRLAFGDVVLVKADRTAERNIQTVPVAVSALSASEILPAQAPSIENLAGRAPTVTFSQNTGYAQLTIRGIGTNAVFAGSDPSVAVYLDGVYLARPAMLTTDFIGLERIEVLRGPQATLYGRNAMGGAVNIVTETPTQEFKAFARTSVGTYGARRIEALIGGPLSNRVMASGSFSRGAERGFVRDLNHPDHPLGGTDVTAARGKLRVLVGGRSELVLSADVSNDDGVPLTNAKALAAKPGFQLDIPSGFRDVRASTEADGRKRQYGGAAWFKYQLPGGTTVTSLTAARAMDYHVLVDSDASELELASSDVHELHHQMTEEVMIAGGRPGLNWVGGLFVFDELDRQPTIVGLGQLQNILTPRVAAHSYAPFGQVTLALTPRLSATAGLRRSRESKDFTTSGGLYTVDTQAPVAGSTYAYTDAIAYTAWTPKVGLDLRAGDRSLLYVSATRGFKTGGFNASSTETGRGYAPEWAWSYEGGVKATPTPGSSVDLSLFYTSYQELQVQTAIRPGLFDISNAASATIRGVEVEGHVSRGPVQVGGHAAWLDARYDRYLAVGAGGVLVDVTGNRLNNAPQLSTRFWVEWERPIDGGRSLVFRADTRAQSTVFYTAINDAIQQQAAYGLLDLSAEIGGLRRCCTVGVSVRNATNQDYITSALSSAPPAISGRPGEPRQASVYLTLRR